MSVYVTPMYLPIEHEYRNMFHVMPDMHTKILEKEYGLVKASQIVNENMKKVWKKHQENKEKLKLLEKIQLERENPFSDQSEK